MDRSDASPMHRTWPAGGIVLTWHARLRWRLRVCCNPGDADGIFEIASESHARRRRPSGVSATWPATVIETTRNPGFGSFCCNSQSLFAEVAHIWLIADAHVVKVQGRAIVGRGSRRRM